MDELEGEEGLAVAYGLGMDAAGMGFGMAYGGAGTGMDALPDAQMQMSKGGCPGCARDEEGLVTTIAPTPATDLMSTYGQDLYYTPGVAEPPYSTGSDGVQYVDASGAQWTNRPHPSPAFSNISAPSPPCQRYPPHPQCPLVTDLLACGLYAQPVSLGLQQRH